MKRIYRIVIVALFIGIAPFTMAIGQEKKSEQKIKVIVNDGGETKVLIDNLFTEDILMDPIQLKDGKLVFIGRSKEDC